MKYELSHDSIAKQIFEKASVELKARRKADAFLDRAFARYQDKKVLLTEDDLEELRPFVGELNISEEEAKFIRKSRRHLRRKRRRNWILALSAITILAIAFVIAAITSVNLKRSEIELKESNEKNQYNSTLFGTTVFFELEGNATKSLQTAFQYPDQLVDYFKREKFRQVFFDAYLQGWYGYFSPFARKVQAPQVPVLAIQYNEQGQLQTLHQDGGLMTWSKQGTINDSVRLAEGFFTAANFSKTRDRAVFYSPNGTAELAFIEDKTVQSLSSNHGKITKVLFGPRGGFHATLTDQQTVELWDSVGNYKALLKRSAGEVVDFQLSDDGMRLLTHVRNRKADSLNIYRLFLPDFSPRPKPLANVRGSYKAATLSPDNVLVFANAQGNIIPRASKRIIEGDEDSPIHKLLFLNQGKHLLSYSDVAIQIWDYEGVLNKKPEAKTPIGEIPLKGIKILEIIPLSDQYFAVLSEQNTLKAYNLKGESILQLVGPKSNFRQLATFPDGPQISSLQWSGNIYDWYLPTSSALHPTYHFPDKPDGMVLLTSEEESTRDMVLYSTNQLYLFDIEDQKMHAAHTAATPILNVGNGPTLNTVVVVFRNGQIEQWKVEGTTLTKEKDIGRVPETIAQFEQLHGDRNALLRTKSGKVWILKTTEEQLKLTPFSGNEVFKRVTPAPNLYAFAGLTTQGEYKIYYGPDFQLLPDLLEDIPGAFISATFFTHEQDGHQFWVGTEDGAVFRLNLSPMDITELTSSPFTGEIEQISMLESRMLVISGAGGQIRFIHSSEVDSSQLETIIPDGQLKSRLADLFSIEDNKYALGYTNSGAVKLWTAGAELDVNLRLFQDSKLKAVTIAENLEHIITLEEDGTLKTWQLHPSDIQKRLEELKILDAN